MKDKFDVLNMLMQKRADEVHGELAVETALIYNEIKEDEVITYESSFITGVKDFFVKNIEKLKNMLSSIFSKIDIDKKYYDDKLQSLKELDVVISKIQSNKFSEYEEIILPIMMGMKLDYKTTVFELKNISLLLPEIKTAVIDFNMLLSKLLVNVNDIKLSNDRNLYRHNNMLYKNESKFTKILSELTEVRKPTDVKKFKEVFNNLNSIRDTKDSYTEVYKNLIKFDLLDYKKQIDELNSLIDNWITTLHGEGSEVKASSNVVVTVRDNVQLIAKLTTSIGIFVAILNQTSSFFTADLKIVEENKKI